MIERMFELAAAAAPVIRVRDGRPTGHSSRLLAAAMALPTGPAQITLLAKVEPEALDDADRVTLLQAWERASRWVDAQRAKAIVAVAGAEPDGTDDFPRELVRVALVECGGSTKTDVDLARALNRRFTATAAALEAGTVSWAHVRVLVRECEHLDDDVARRVEARVLERAGGQPPARFRESVRRAVIRVDPGAAAREAATAVEERGVDRVVHRDGRASLILTGPTLDIARTWTALDTATGGKAHDDARTLDQRRYDTAIELLSGGGPAGEARRHGAKPVVHLHADLATWLGLANDPVEVEGFGPVPAGMARELLLDSRWRAVVTDAVNGLAISVSDSTYTPSPRTFRHIAVIDRTCIFPGCHTPAQRCDVEHSIPHDRGGCTDPDNCGLVCRRHHRLKTFTRWQWRRLPDGDVEWTDPTGRRWIRAAIRHGDPPSAA